MRRKAVTVSNSHNPNINGKSRQGKRNHRAADAIYMLNGFEESKGAMCELAYAEKLGLKVMEQE